MLFCHVQIFFKINFFEKVHVLSECKTVGSTGVLNSNCTLTLAGKLWVRVSRIPAKLARKGKYIFKHVKCILSFS